MNFQVVPLIIVFAAVALAAAVVGLSSRHAGTLFSIVLWLGVIPYLAVVFAPSFRWAALAIFVMGGLLAVFWDQFERSASGPGGFFVAIMLYATLYSLVTATIVRIGLSLLRSVRISEGILRGLALAGIFINPTLAVLFMR